MTLLEISKDTTIEKVKKETGCEFKISPNLKNFE
jgi:acyl CoA:acetate/3-ketoacid CoA transferase beta subunit